MPNGRNDRDPRYKPCIVNTIVKTQTYSRGNNNSPELLAQFLATGTFYQYETARFYLTISTNSNCTCVGHGGSGCAGSIEIQANLIIQLRTQTHDLDDRCLVCGPPPSTGTTEYNDGNAPKPDLDLKYDDVMLPAAAGSNTLSRLSLDNLNWSASATCNISCSAGRYFPRFYLVLNIKTGTSTPVDFSTVIPLFFIDCDITITNPAKCQLDISLKAYMSEFLKDYDFTTGGTVPASSLSELPELIHSYPSTDAPTTTRNIMKLTEEDGILIDSPFPPKAF